MGRNVAVVIVGPDGSRARGAPPAVRRAPEGRRGRQDQARPAHRRVGSLHPSDPHRGRRHGGLRGSRRRRVDDRDDRRVDRHRQARRHRLARLSPHGGPEAGDRHRGQERQDRQARARRRRPLPAAGRRDPRGRSGLEGQGRRRARRVSRPRAPRRATSRAVCRAWRSCSRRAVRRIAAIIAEKSRHDPVRQRLQEQAPPDAHAGDEGRSRSST